MKNSILFTIAICTISVIYPMEETQYTDSMNIDNTTSEHCTKQDAKTIRSLVMLCYLKIIEENIQDLSTLPVELQETLTKDSEYISNNPELSTHVPCSSPTKKRFKKNKHTKTKELLDQPKAKKRLFIQE